LQLYVHTTNKRAVVTVVKNVSNILFNEIIVITDGSQDTTGRLIKKLNIKFWAILASTIRID